MACKAATAASMYGPGPQMKACALRWGRASSASCATEGTPCTESSQWITVSRAGWASASALSSLWKMTDFSSRLA